jgi:threonyl-tRNA synthetase
MNNTDEEHNLFPLETMRHSCAHVMAQAVLDLYPGTKLAIGPSTEDGFYYDFDPQGKHKFSELDFEAIEKKMKEIIEAKQEFVREEISKEDAIKRFEAAEEPYKLEIIRDLPDGTISLYKNGPFTDLCRGPHLNNTSEIKAFKLLSVAGAYWRGSEKNPMLQRIYGTCFPSQKELDEYLLRLEEAKKRDHRRVGKDLKLFVTTQVVGAGLPLWLPNGATIRRILERYITDMEIAEGYQHVYTPVLAKTELYKISGHWEHYRESMYPAMNLDEDELVLRPMCCPHHIEVYKSEGLRSYRELPLRIAELGQMFRMEKSGELTGLCRVRNMCLNDAHIFCMEDQIHAEIIKVLHMVERAYKDLGFTTDHYTYRLSLRDPEDKVKYVDNPAMWEKAENELRAVFKELNLPHYEAIGEAAFYGPKIDIQLKNVLGKEETVSTIQVDRHLPERFQLEYVGEDGKPHRPVMIHRGVISTMERMTAFLIEYYAGAFPVWLSPIQAIILPIKDSVLEYARNLQSELQKMGLRVNLDNRNEKLGYKIREAQMHKIPYMLVIGEKELQENKIAVRRRDGKDLGAMPVDSFKSLIQEDICTKRSRFE